MPDPTAVTAAPTDPADDPAAVPVPTVLERMVAAGISEDRARAHLERGAVVLSGEVITDPATLAPRPTVIGLDYLHRTGPASPGPA